MDRQLQWIESLKDKIRPADLLTILEQQPTQIKVLSLDCFDTLIWRKTAAPVDIFYALQHKPLFQALGLSAQWRKQAEIKARQLTLYKQAGDEVSLSDIYHELHRSLTQEQITALITEELTVEKENCYAFPPVVNLIIRAYELGIKVVIVSDTYFTESELRALLESTLPPNVMQMLSHLFCSSAYRRAKGNGLFENVLNTLHVSATEILHIGDNFSADYIAPRSLNINARHLVAEAEPITDLLRLQAMSACVVNSEIRGSQPLFSPFRGIFAETTVDYNKTHALLGYASLGPLMYAFANFICTEIKTIEEQGKQPKVLFLMRDAYLPFQACTTLTGKSLGHQIRISRFAAYAASFRTEEDIDRYLLTIGKSNRFHDIARQLLLPDKVVEPIIKIAQRSVDPELEFIRQIHRKDIMRIIFNKSTDYFNRLKSYLEKEIDLKSGDTLVFVDLGYHGTVQHLLTPLLNKMGVEVMGRYFISLRAPGSETQRHGFLDTSWCDDRLLRMLVGHIAMFEQLCTANESSSIDYDQSGAIVLSDVKMNTTQQTSLALLQSMCLQFVKDAKSFFASTHSELSPVILRETALAELSRMLFLQTAPELHSLQHFQFDVNMGTSDIYQLFDSQQGLTGLRRRGLFYTEHAARHMRTNYPAELRMAGFELALTSMVQNRLGLDIKLRDLLQRQELLPALLTQQGRTTREMLEACATYDGYFSVWAPVGDELAVCIGEKYQWLQIESAELIQTDAFIHQAETQNSLDAWSYLTCIDMESKGNGLFNCAESSVIVLRSATHIKLSDYVFRLVFRPIMPQPDKPQPSMNPFKATFSISI